MAHINQPPLRIPQDFMVHVTFVGFDHCSHCSKLSNAAILNHPTQVLTNMRLLRILRIAKITRAFRIVRLVRFIRCFG